jgi:FAD/FMN-containing dehydrogenase
MAMRTVADGKLLWPGEAAYDRALADAVWNGRKPSRRPAAIVLAEDADDVVAGVRIAKERGLQVSVRAGGHSWVGAGVREGALLVDVSRLRSMQIDAPAARAVVGPGVHGIDLNAALAADGLFFPSGHCPSVALGGFLLVGGWGWNSREWGPGCALVEAVDVVTADGELIRADAEHDSDVLWAARGAGPGFFGVVTAFHLQLRPAPVVVGMAHNYPLAACDELLTWQHDIRHEMPANVDQVVYGTQHLTGGEEPTLLLSATVFAASEEEARASLAIFEAGPVADRALWRRGGALSLEELQGLPNGLYARGLRYNADSAYSNAPASELVPALADVFATPPTPRSHVMWMNTAGGPALPDMCFSVLGDTLIEVYAVWDEAADDARMDGWTIDHVRGLDGVSSGSYMGADNMAGRGVAPSAYLAPSAHEQLERLRSVHDPDGRFCSFLVSE